VHDSQKLDDVLDLSNTGNGVWADSAYRSVQIEAGLTAKGLQRSLSRKHPDASQALLPPRHHRPRRRCAAEKRDELAPFHVWMAPAWQEKM
jgi:hypothetical protein